MANYYAGAALRSPIVGDSSNPILRHDQMLDDDTSNGVRYFFDLGFPYSYPGGPAESRAAAGNPLNGAAIVDVANIGDGAFSSVANETTYAGGGFDFSNVSARGHEVLAPDAALAGVRASANQYMAVLFYVRLPTAANWYTDTGFAPLFCTTDVQGGWADQADLMSVGLASGNVLRATRTTTAVGTVAQRSITVPSSMDSLVSQILAYRNAEGFGIRLKNSVGELSLFNSADNAAATPSLASARARWGIPLSLWNFGSKPSLANAKNYRLYRGWVEDLSVSGRDIISVANSDYTRTVARGVFS